MATVLLALSPEGLQEAVRLATATGSPVWCGSDAISDQGYAELVRGTVSVSRFMYPLMDEPDDVLAEAVSTIEEHHPGAIIWIEHRQLKG